MQWRVNTAQVVIILLAICCVTDFAVQYHQVHSPPPPAPTLAPPPMRDPRQRQYAQEIHQWQKQMADKGITVTCPYLGLDNVARLDLPDKVPVTLADWDASAEAKAAQDAYNRLVRARKAARLGSAEACIVHVYDTQGEEVARAAVEGVVTSAEAPIE